MSEGWIQESEGLLRRMKELSLKEKSDRLEVVNSMFFTLNILERSLNGWRLWIRNLSLMSQFTLEELVEMEMTLEKQIQPFIEYDIEASKRWMDKFPQVSVVRRRMGKKEGRGMYV